MTERVRITRVKAGATLAGQPVAELYSHDTRLRFPFLTLFDMSELLTVAINPADLKKDEYTLCNFWGHYELSTTKKTSEGNPYKDVIRLESIGAPATTTSTDTTAMLGELRAIKALLLQIARALSPDATEPPVPAQDDEAEAKAKKDFISLYSHATASGKTEDLIAAGKHIPDDESWVEALANLSSALADPPAETWDQARADRISALNGARDHTHTNGLGDPLACPNCLKDRRHCGCDSVHAVEVQATEPELTEREARTEFYKLAGPAIAEKRIKAETVNDLTTGANGTGWPEALARLQTALAE
jgi:hypothetical protein